MVDRVDVLVVGAGIAGLAAALSAPSAARVAIVAPRGELSSSEWARGGIAVPIDAPDVDAHLEDTVAAGAGLVDATFAKGLIQEAPSALVWLESLGASFAAEPGLEAGHRRPRIRHADGDATGAAVMRVLRARAAEVPRLHGELVGLAAIDREVVGAWIRPERGGVRLVRAGWVVLATGGASAVFDAFTSPPHNLGVGIAAAAWAGARVGDLEFVQFHPTAIAGPTSPLPLATEALRGAGARLVDDGGTPIAAALPRGDLATRDELARLVDSWPRPVFLDARPIGLRLIERFPSFAEAARRLGVDPTAEPVPVRVAAHFTIGGILTDDAGRTSLPGLLAIGECAATGLHGANRLASNSLLEGVVMGRRVGDVLEPRHIPRDPPPAPEPRGALDLAQLRTLTARALGPLRDGDSLDEALVELDRHIRPSDDVSLQAATWMVRAMVASAIARQGSVGAHARRDARPEDPVYRLVVDGDGNVRRETPR